VRPGVAPAERGPGVRGSQGAGTVAAPRLREAAIRNPLCKAAVVAAALIAFASTVLLGLAIDVLLASRRAARSGQPD
jgi:hypothetical protein